MRQGNDRLDALGQHIVEQFIIKGQSRFVWLLFIPVGENTCPCNRCAQAAETHFGKQVDILAEMMIEIDGFVVGVVFARYDVCRDLAQDIPCARGHHISGTDALAAFTIGAFDLMGGNGAAPQKVFSHAFAFTSSIASPTATCVP